MITDMKPTLPLKICAWWKEKSTSRSYPSRMTANLGIDLVMAVLRFAIHDEKQGQRSDDELYDLIDEYCSIEGQTMDDLGGL